MQEGVDFLRAMIDVEAEEWLKAYESGQEYKPQRLDDIKEIAELVGIYGNQGLVLRGERYAAEVFKSGMVFFRPLRQVQQHQLLVDIVGIADHLTEEDCQRLFVS